MSKDHCSPLLIKSKLCGRLNSICNTDTYFYIANDVSQLSRLAFARKRCVLFLNEIFYMYECTFNE